MRKVLFFVMLCWAATAVHSQEPGTPNSSFGDGGVAIISASSSHDFPNALLEQSDGKIITAGRCRPDSINYIIYVSRQNADGSLDMTFGTNGFAYFQAVSDIHLNSARDAVIGNNGLLYLTGYTYDLTNNSAFVLCLDEDGTEYTNFGDNGFAISEYGGGIVYEAIDVDSYGRPIVTGYLNDTVLVRRYNAVGQLDPTFGDNGTVQIAFNDARWSYGLAIKVLDDNKILVAGKKVELGTNIENAFIMRLEANGTLDNTFGNNGRVDLNVGQFTESAQSIAVDADGNYLVAGHYEVPNNSETLPKYDAYVTRILSNGTIDTSFGTNGFARFEPFEGETAVNKSEAVVTAHDGQIFGTIYSFDHNTQESRAYVYNLNENGQLNEDFAGTGIMMLELSAIEIRTKEIMLSDSGKVIVTGLLFTDNGYSSDIFVANINADIDMTESPITVKNRKVIIEEFTGRNCAYCPDGHKVANEIAAANPGKVFPVNIHAGGFAPTTYPNLNTTYGTEICNGFNVSGFPTGNINRNSPTTLSRNAWESNTDEQLSQIAEVNIEGVVDINKDTRTAEITVNLDYTANSASSTNYLTIMMLQDSIWGSQSGASYNPEQYVDGQYCHMHVLRDIITSTWGDEINQTTAGTRIVKKYTYEIPETIGNPNGVEVDLDNIYFLAFVAEQYQDTPTRPILNVDRLRDADDVIDEPEDLENHWTADPTIYPNNMTIIGVLQLYGVEERSTDFEIGAFCGDELRGSHRLKYEHALDRYYAYLLLHGNPDDNITFKLYDHRTGQVSELINTDNINFEVNGTLGGIKNPYIFNFNDVQERQLSSGWNWFSSYINIDGSDGLSMLKNELNTNGLQIKSQNAFVSYENGSWYGTLNSTITEDMYMIQTTSPQNIELTGKKVNAEERPITLGTNWKWISYPLDVPMNVGTALININPNEGDYIKSQTGFAQYGEGLGWKGTLASMIPGDGYMYQNTSGETMTLIYPDPDTKASTDAVHNITSENNHWIPDMTKFPTNMSIIATVDNSYDNDFEVAAFCDGQCRGSARPIYIEELDSHFIFLTVYGEDKETIIFKYYDVENQEVYSINNEITYSVNATLGSLREPYIMSLTMTDTDEILANEITTYPNPVDRNVGIYLGRECDKVEIYNSMGVKVSEYENVNRIEGIETAGIYVIKIINENAIKYDRIVVR